MGYSLQTGQRPELIDESIYRSRDILRVFRRQIIDDTIAKYSEPCQVGGFRHFTLYINLLSKGVSTHTIHIEPMFLDPHDSHWHTYKQGLFAALFYEDADCTTEIHEVFNGDCAGRDMCFRVTGVGVSETYSFTISLSVEFWN